MMKPSHKHLTTIFTNASSGRGLLKNNRDLASNTRVLRFLSKTLKIKWLQNKMLIIPPKVRKNEHFFVAFRAVLRLSML